MNILGNNRIDINQLTATSQLYRHTRKLPSLFVELTEHLLTIQLRQRPLFRLSSEGRLGQLRPSLSLSHSSLPTHPQPPSHSTLVNNSQNHKSKGKKDYPNRLLHIKAEKGPILHRPTF
jgi:hypothetical protein